MANALFNALNTLDGSTPTRANPLQMLQQLKNNPVGMLRQAGLNIPDAMNDPRSILNHLVQSGQISQPRRQKAMNMMRKGKP